MEELRTRLVERYREPHRRYHDLRHLHEVLAAVDELAGELTGRGVDAETVRWAAWYHDAVYDVRRDDSEERSAQLAARELGDAGWPTARADEVARLVRLTADHRSSADDAAGAVLCDADLRILSAAPERYAEYAADVRAEYAHVSDQDFRAGRARVLRGLVVADRLYRTETGWRRWEERARANVAAELRDLH